MALVTLEFRFSQRFPFGAREVYEWATDYQPTDIELMGRRGRRQIQRLNEETLVLTDSVVRDDESTVRKPKLIRLYAEHLRWVNTHIGGPNRHSQFIYEVVPDGKKGSRLDFTGSQLEEMAKPTRKTIASRTRELAREDAKLWKELARAMKAERKRAAADGASGKGEPPAKDAGPAEARAERKPKRGKPDKKAKGQKAEKRKKGKASSK